MAPRIYYFPTDDSGNEVGSPVTVELKADGTADLSGLPPKLREHLEVFGVADELHQGRLFARDGESFLEALLEATDFYWRFRSTPEPLASGSRKPATFIQGQLIPLRAKKNRGKPAGGQGRSHPSYDPRRTADGIDTRSAVR